MKNTRSNPNSNLHSHTNSASGSPFGASTVGRLKSELEAEARALA